MYKVSVDGQGGACNNHSYTYLLSIISGSVLSSMSDAMGDQNNEEYSDVSPPVFVSNDPGSEDWYHFGLESQQDVPTMSSVAQSVMQNKGIKLDSIQYVAYEIICASFLLNLLEEKWAASSCSDSFGASDAERGNASTIEAMNRIKQKLKDIGGKEPLRMFVTGPAGAGKSTAINVAQQFCFEFCRAVGIQWEDNTFLFTAITGCAAALFDGVTLHSAAYLNTADKNITKAMIEKWKYVKLLIVDEVSFSTVDQMNKLNNRLNFIRRRLGGHQSNNNDMLFGGFSIIFSGDFRQIPPVKCREFNLLYRGANTWVNSLNVAIVLKSSHRFMDDPEYGELLMKMWSGKFSKDDCDIINERVRVALPDLDIDDDIAYACHTNAERTAIHASTFQQHIAGFPSVESNELPPQHTLIVEADLMRAPKRKPKKGNKSADEVFPVRVTRTNCEKIYSKCGDSDMVDQTKFIDPALKLYKGAHCMINDNDDIASGRGNGTLCRISLVKLKQNTRLRLRNYDGKKVYSVNVRDVEYIECEHFPKKPELVKMQQKLQSVQQLLLQDPQNRNLVAQSEEIAMGIDNHIQSRKFKLTPKKYYCNFFSDLISSSDTGLPKVAVKKKDRPMQRVAMVQFPLNLNDATTAHKLQGSSKNMLIVNDWFYSHGWVYTVLSRVRTLKGLFLMKPLAFEKHRFETPKELSLFDTRMRQLIPERARQSH